MIKVRYIRFRCSGLSLDAMSERARRLKVHGIDVVRTDSSGLFVLYTVTRHLSVMEIRPDGEEVRTTVPTMEQYKIRLFSVGSKLYLCLLDPPRGTRVACDVLDLICAEHRYFVEAYEIDKSLIDRHVGHFGLARLVSAKVRDFRVDDDAVARLEVSSKEGLSAEIAPFLSGKFYRVDSMTFEISHDFRKGLITYASNGTLKVSDALAEFAFPAFESLIG